MGPLSASGASKGSRFQGLVDSVFSAPRALRLGLMRGTKRLIDFRRPSVVSSRLGTVVDCSALQGYSDPMKELKGRVVAVTGAGSGIGRALAIELGKKGCRLALADIHQERLAETRDLLPRKDLGDDSPR